MTDAGAGLWSRARGALLPPGAVEAALRLVTTLARRTMGSSSAAGVTVVADERKITAAASDDLVERADGLQYGLDEGPCLTAWRDRELVRVDELRTETRWPRWANAVQPLGVRACLSAPLLADTDAIGAIKVYSRESAVYGEREEELLQLFAQQAALLLGPAQLGLGSQHETFRDMLVSRDVVSQAKGILMALDHMDEHEAFEVLVRRSLSERSTVREVARHVVASVDRPDA